ncbi:Phospholipase A(1) chloroplastic [Micractinium conductrix]|uniref:Phospholipase A(1) chloroplastic n=1 Tax=Micractinium conductrix TaxID=554055 RepID=A0A2P6VDJ3_9CHLO|nr:Phospholipase A(1) chloroplastic [Micractinium conductrix]|eukprot:PSC72147.1 Phospholipase A(1) chloroplastic [Micractinium conductrix]
MAGLLEVSIQRAVALPAVDPAPFTSDPYLTVAVGNSLHTTRTMLNNLNPQWHERCTLFVRDPGAQRLSVTVFDRNIATAGTFLGEASVDLLQVCDGQPHQLQLQLEGGPCAEEGLEEGSNRAGSSGGQESGHGNSGSVRLGCHFVPFAELLADGAAPEVDGRPLLATPGEVPLKADWRSLLDLAGVAAHAMFTPVAFVENATSNTQVWLHWNRDRREACLAFRGTEQDAWKDYLTDLHLVPAPLDPDRVAAAPHHAELGQVSAPPREPGTLERILSNVEAAKEQVAAERQAAEEATCSAEQAERSIISTAVQAVSTTAEDLAAMLDNIKQQIEASDADQGGDTDQPWVHSGFLSAFDSVRPAVLSLVAALLAGEERGWRIFLTGHSLGGALATLGAWDCAHRKWDCQEPPELVVYTFGAPRVGNRPWAEHYNELVPSTWRIVNERDSVATVPRLMGYAHVGHAVMLKSGGDVEIETHTTKRMGEGVGVGDITPAVSAIVAAKVPEMLPEMATKALAKVGIEVAASGSAEEAAVVAEASASLDAAAAGISGSRGGEGLAQAAMVAAVTPDTLEDWWQQEVEAWSMLLDGSALNEHMEPLYLENLKRCLQALAKEGREQGEDGPGGAAAAAVEAASSAASSADSER